MTTRDKFLWMTAIALIAAMLTWPFVYAMGLVGLVIYPLAWLLAFNVIAYYLRGE